jgi:hypothetical protein
VLNPKGKVRWHSDGEFLALLFAREARSATLLATSCNILRWWFTIICRYQRSFFRSWPNPLLPILRQHGFSQCLRQAMRRWLNVRTPRYQTRHPSDSSANLGATQRRTLYVPEIQDEQHCSDRRSEHGILWSALERRSRLMTPQRPNWQELAAQASKELDPVRLMSLVDELNRALEQNEQTSMRLETQKFV